MRGDGDRDSPLADEHPHPTGPLRRVAVRVAVARREQAIALLLDLAPDGFEEVDLGAAVELAVYADTLGEARIRRAFPAALSSAVEPGWDVGWRAFHRPARAGGIWIGPPWERPPLAEPAVTIDPGRAFGTGGHPTTRLCLELLAELERGSLLDAGCGSGVLAIAAARLGFGPIAAVDADPVAVEEACRNAAANGVALDLRLADVTADELPPVHVVVANIALAVAELALARIDARLAVASGYLAHERPDVAGWAPLGRRELEGWAADALVRL